jgi:hypothetical protein
MITADLEKERESQGLVAPSVSSDVQFCRWSTIFWMVLVAIAVRISFILLLRTYQFGRIDDYGVGEATNIAASIARGLGFSSPFSFEYTGPTSWIAPAYPYFAALVFRYFGIMTHASSIVIFAAQSLFSALTIIPILGIASRTVGRRAGMWAAWTWILFPWFSKWAVTWLWEVSLSALLFTLLFWYALCLPETFAHKSGAGSGLHLERSGNWIGFGALWGFALLVNPALSTLLPVSLAWCTYNLHLRKSEWLKPALTSLLVCVIVISPWLLRNRAVFGRWVFLRSNFGAEFALGNYHDSFGRGWGGRHPSGNGKEYHDYMQMGEIAYVQSKEKLGMQFVRDSPWEFIMLSAKRTSYFWDGSAMGYRVPVPWYWVPSSFAVVSFLVLPALLVAHRKNLHAWQMFFGALLLYPLPYYLTFSHVRYRHALEPIILLLIAYAAIETVKTLTCFVRWMGAPDTLPAPEKIWR